MFLWNPTKTINFFRLEWLIDKAYVKNICYDFFLYSKSKGHWPTFSTFLASRQLTMSIHWPCYCTVHVYVVIQYCDNMWSFWVEAILCGIFIVCLYMYCLWRSNYQNGWELESHLPVNLTTFCVLVPSQHLDFQRHIIW
jgi:hypothetical protein